MAGEQVLEEPLPIAKAGHQRVGLGQFAGDERAPAVRGWQAGIRFGQQLADLREAEAGMAGKVDQRDAGQDRRGVAALATAPWRRVEQAGLLPVAQRDGGVAGLASDLSDLQFATDRRDRIALGHGRSSPGGRLVHGPTRRNSSSGAAPQEMTNSPAT